MGMAHELAEAIENSLQNELGSLRLMGIPNAILRLNGTGPASEIAYYGDYPPTTTMFSIVPRSSGGPPRFLEGWQQDRRRGQVLGVQIDAVVDEGDVVFEPGDVERARLRRREDSRRSL